jgi:hypothetical protein
MMAIGLGKRVARLEDHPRFGSDTVGVGAINLAAVGTKGLQNFASTYGLPQRCAIWFVDGPAGIALPPTPVGLIRGDDEALWVKAGETYPHLVAVWNDGDLAVWRIDNRAEQAEFDRSHGARPERMTS